MSDSRNTLLKEVCQLQSKLNTLVNEVREKRKTNSAFFDPNIDMLTNRIKELQNQIQIQDKARGHNVSVSDPSFTATRK